VWCGVCFVAVSADVIKKKQNLLRFCTCRRQKICVLYNRSLESGAPASGNDCATGRPTTNGGSAHPGSERDSNSPNYAASAGHFVSPGVRIPDSGRRWRKGARWRGVRSNENHAEKRRGEIRKNHGKAQTSGESRRCRLRRRFLFPSNQSWAAKLLKAVQPIYPPDACGILTGDVRIESEVDNRADLRDEDFAGAEQFRQVPCSASAL